jgi:lysophospholipase L1-like esterase
MTLWPRSRLPRALLIALASLLVGLGTAEIGLRVFSPVKYHAPIETPDAEWRTLVHRRSEVPGLLYELVPNVKQDVRGMRIETNALGLRGPETTREKPAGVVRIAALGDSVTFGYGVAGSEAWPAVLGQLLNERAAGRRRYEVLNFGTSGYSTRDEAAVLEHKALAMEPDLVLVGYFLNDPDFEPYQQLHRYFRGGAWWQLSHVARLVARARFDARRQRLGRGDLYRYYHAPDEPSWESVLTAFDAMRAATGRANVRVLVVIFPPYAGFESWERYGYRDVHAQVRQAAEQRGFEVLDLVDAWAARGETKDAVRLDNEHPNAWGHRIAAEAVLELLVQRHTELLRAPF